MENLQDSEVEMVEKAASLEAVVATVVAAEAEAEDEAVAMVEKVSRKMKWQTMIRRESGTMMRMRMTRSQMSCVEASPIHLRIRPKMISCPTMN